MERILGFGEDHICLFCGKPEQQHWDEYDDYYECDCADAVKYRKIKDQIDKLESQLPQPKYEINNEPVLRKINDED